MGAGVGVATTVLAFGALWLRLEIPVVEPNILGIFYIPLKEEFLLLFFAMAPTLLWAWTLVFAAPFLRSSSQSRTPELFLWMAAGCVAGAILLPLATGTGANLFLLQTGQTRAWIRTLVSLFWVQLPLTGAVFGALCAALSKGERARVLRGACVLVSLEVTWLTWQWAQGQASNWLHAPALVALVAAPTTLWALGLLFFSLVARGRSALRFGISAMQ